MAGDVVHVEAAAAVVEEGPVEEAAERRRVRVNVGGGPERAVRGRQPRPRAGVARHQPPRRPCRLPPLC